MTAYNVAIMGATGAVGQVMLEILAERNFPVGQLRLLASARSAGKEIEFGSDKITVEELRQDSFAGVDIVLASAGGSLSKEFNPYAVASGREDQSPDRQSGFPPNTAPSRYRPSIAPVSGGKARLLSYRR